MKADKRHCCKIDCKKDATWSTTNGKFEDDVDFCDDHLVEHLYIDECNYVTAIEN